MIMFQRFYVAFVFFVCMGSLCAAPAEKVNAVPPITAAVMPEQRLVESITPALAKRELLQAMQTDGMITKDQRDAAEKKFITSADTTRFDAYTNNSWTQHVTWSLTLKCLGLLLLFIALWGWIRVFAKHFNGWLRKIPIVVYQSVFIGMSLAGLFIPEKIYPAHAFDLAIFCMFTTPLLIIWFVGTNRYLGELLTHLFSNETVASYAFLTVGAVYFLGAAVALDSQIGGIAAMWFMLLILYFFVHSIREKLFQYRDHTLMVRALASHLLGLALWMVLSPIHANAVTSVLRIAATYYLPAAICTMLLVAMAPLSWTAQRGNRVFYFALYIVLVSVSFSNVFSNVPAMNSLLALTGFATILFWIVVRSFKLGSLLGTFITGSTLYVLSLNIDTIRTLLNTVHFSV